jgi:hypothetical protein
MLEWFNRHLLWIAGLSLVTFLGTLVAIPILVVRMRPDYFVSASEENEPRRSYSVPHLIFLVLKNMLGMALVVAGVILSIPLIPGQGILTLLIGISLLNFPGKRALELRIARQRHVLGAINWIRARADRPPLQLPAKPD